jgi:hypothetical protein
MNKRRLGILAGAVGVAIGAGTAFAVPGPGPVHPDAGGVFHGCVKSAGDVYLVDHAAGQNCKTQGSQPEQHVHWSQTGPQGPAGADGVSVTSSALGSGDPNCSAGGSQFSAAGGNVTYACNGLEGDKGDKGDKGDTGAAGPSAAYANYGPGTITIGDGLTQTVASVTVPAGSYVLSGVVHAIGADGSDFLQCFFVAGGTVNQKVAVLTDDGSEPILADVTLSSPANPVFLRCFALNGEILAQGQMIATRVGSVTASE